MQKGAACSTLIVFPSLGNSMSFHPDAQGDAASHVCCNYFLTPTARREWLWKVWEPHQQEEGSAVEGPKDQADSL